MLLLQLLMTFMYDYINRFDVSIHSSFIFEIRIEYTNRLDYIHAIALLYTPRKFLNLTTLGSIV